MLEFRNITITNRDTERVLVKNFNFVLNKGDKAVIIGEEGNGKSTLLKLAVDERLIDDYCTYSGEVIKRNVTVGYLEQEMDEKWLNKRVKDFFKGVDHYQFDQKQKQRLRLSNTTFESEQIISTLSGGEKVKIRLIKLIAQQPDVLLLDEPTNDLDLKTLEWLEDFIEESEIPILYVSHDETLIERTANIIIHLEQVRRKTVPRYTIVKMGYSDYVERRLSTLSKQEQVARKQRADYSAQMQRWQQVFNRVEHEQENISRGNPHGGRLLKKKMKALKSQEKRIERQSEEFLDIPDVEDAIAFHFSENIVIPNGKRVLEFDLEMLETGGRVLSRNIHLDVIGAEHIAIIGENGIGKSTLLRIVLENLKGRNDLRVGYMPQSYTQILDDAKTPIDFLTDSGKKEDRTKAYTFLGSMKYTPEEMNSKIGELSGGQKGKLILLSLILKEYNVLILDEPTRNFSPLSNPVIRGALSNYKGVILSVSHDRKYITEVCSTIYELSQDGLCKIDSI